MHILEDLYYGEINPFERKPAVSEQDKQLVQYISRHHQELLQHLSESDAVTFEKYRDCSMELQRKMELDAFIYGFKLGGRIMLEIFTEENI